MRAALIHLLTSRPPVHVSKQILVYGCLLAAGRAAALPIGFGINQRDRAYDELTSDNFVVYHDHRVPSEGAMTLNALEGARPFLEDWFQIKRQSPLRVITSAVTENASFANFITDALEIQTGGQGDRSLAWHEYTHSTMYRHFDNLLGPAGSILNLPFMPPWFLEGLAETTSVSVGSDITAGIERYHALTGDWPSYDRLHSLYAKYGFFERGYATAGALTTYALKRADANRLPAMLRDFRTAAMPWFYPLTLLKMPMDSVLEHAIGISGKDLYEQYKKDAAAFWTSYSNDPLLIKLPGERRAFSSVYGMRSDGKVLHNFSVVDDQLSENAVVFDEKTGFAVNLKTLSPALSDYEGYARVYSANLKAGVRFEKVVDEDWTRIKAVSAAGTTERFRPGSVFQLWETPQKLVWLEQELAVTRLCVDNKPGAASVAVSCPITATVPRKLRSLGARMTAPGSAVAQEIWLVESDEHLKGTLYTVLVVDAATLAVTRKFPPTQARPISVAFAGADTYLLVAERNRRTVQRIDQIGHCQGVLASKDHIIDAFGFADGSLALALYHGDNTDVLQLKKGTLKEQACHADSGGTSPLQAALRLGPKTSMRTALEAANLWVGPDGSRADNSVRLRPLGAGYGGQAPLTAPTAKSSSSDSDAIVQKAKLSPEQLAKEPALDKDLPPQVHAATSSKPRVYRARPLFMVPWIGGDDALGTQLGAVSVPLMDDLQNETVRATFLYGMASHFPNTEIAFTETRWRPTITAAAYRQQTYNGTLPAGRNAAGQRLVESNYLDEKGVRVGADIDYAILGGGLGVGVGVKAARLEPYLGVFPVKHGRLVEPSLALAFNRGLGAVAWSNSVSGRIAPPKLNQHFDYNEVAAATSLSRGLFWSSRFTLGLEGARTRGKKMRELREYYQPLKTFIPGSGGGYNQNNFNFIDDGSSISTLRFGDNQARAKATWTMPLIPDIDKTLWFVYMESLDFTAFYNYGTAWYGTASPPKGWDHMIPANGYNVDLLLERYGVHVNLGLGTGHVMGEPWAFYGKFGFDAFL